MELTVTGLSIYPVKSMRGVRQQQLRLDRRGLSGDRCWMVVDNQYRFLTQRQLPQMATLSAIPAANGLRLCDQQGDELEVRLPGSDEPRVSVQVWADQVEAVMTAKDSGRWLSKRLGRDCHLVYLPEQSERQVAAFEGHRVGFADGYPALLTCQASLADLNLRLVAAARQAIPMDRFRPNIVVSSAGGEKPFDEDRWAQLLVPGGRLINAKACERCLVTTTDQQSGTRDADREPLATLGRFRSDADGAVLFGINLVPLPDTADGAITLAVGDRLEVVYQ